MKLTDRQKRTAVVVASSTLIGFLGDVIMYSVAKSEGSSFKLHFPVGKELAQVVAVGFLTGIAIDVAINQIVERQKPAYERDLDKIVERDLKLIDEGKLDVVSPEKIDWLTKQEVQLAQKSNPIQFS
jgi:hypothetical protein